jgi:hypothetical protein
MTASHYDASIAQIENADRRTSQPAPATHPYAYWINYGYQNGEGSIGITLAAPIAGFGDVEALTDLISQRVGQSIVVRTWQQFPTADH